MTALCSVELLTAGQQMNVAVCNLDGVREPIIAKAKAETELVFRSAGVTIEWGDCDTFPTPDSLKREPWFFVRLRTGKPPRTVGPASLDVMGKAFVEEHGGGYMADAYFQAIQDTSEQHHGESGVLLGFVMAHELGHLLLGPGHTPDGVMQAAWGQKQMDALGQRWLKFTEDSAARIRRALEARAAGDAGGKLVVREALRPVSFEIEATPRIGISQAAELPLRFLIRDNRFVRRTR
jgi:hypothetical protein